MKLTKKMQGLQSCVRMEVDERMDLLFLVQLISDIVVMYRVQTDIPDRDNRIDRPSVRETDMQGEYDNKKSRKNAYKIT